MRSKGTSWAGPSLKANLNDTAQKILREEALHTCEHIRNSMSTMGSTIRPFENFYGENPKIIGSLLEFGRIGYVTKWDKFKKQILEKHLRRSWWDIPTTIQGIRTSCTTQKPRESL